MTKRYDENLGEPLRAVKEDVEKEWAGKVRGLEDQLRTSRIYALECERALDKEHQVGSALVPATHLCIVLDLFFSNPDSEKVRRGEASSRRLRD